jgi:hypothetical protein
VWVNNYGCGSRYWYRHRLMNDYRAVVNRAYNLHSCRLYISHLSVCPGMVAHMCHSCVMPYAAVVQVMDVYFAGWDVHIIAVINAGSLCIADYGAKNTHQYYEAKYRLFHIPYYI